MTHTQRTSMLHADETVSLPVRYASPVRRYCTVVLFTRRQYNIKLKIAGAMQSVDRIRANYWVALILSTDLNSKFLTLTQP